MFDKILFLVAMGILFFLVGFAFLGSAQALNPFDIDYPISELGNCGSQNDCRVFCDDPGNQGICLAWASDNGFIPKEEADKMQKHIEEMERFEEGEIPAGPGGCSSREECDNYCSQPEHGEECLNFGIEHGFIPPEEAERIREDMNKTGPGGCSSREECDTFCSNPDNGEICMNFAVEDGMMTQEEADFILEMMEREKEFRGGPRGPRGPEDDFDEEKARVLLEGGEGGPGGCRTMEDCENYCEEPGNDEECMNFAVEHGLIPEDKIEIMKKMMTEGGPGGCRGPEECDEYCSQDDNQEKCFDFAKEHNLISEEELEMMEKMMGMGGPGGCGDKRECDDYCQSPDNMEECMMFSVDMGMTSEEEANKMIRHIKNMEERMRYREGEFEREGDFDHPGKFEERRGEKGFIPHDAMKNIPEDMLREMKEKGMMPPDGFEQFVPREKFDERGRQDDFNKFEDFKDFDDEKFKEFMPQEFENFIPPEGDFIEPEEFFEEEFEDFEEPTSFNNPSLLGAVFGPFLEIFSY